MDILEEIKVNSELNDHNDKHDSVEYVDGDDDNDDGAVPRKRSRQQPQRPYKRATVAATSSSSSSSDRMPGGGRIVKRVDDSKVRDCVPDEIAFRIRAYLDMLFGVATIEKIRIYMGFSSADRSNRDSMYAVPTIVDAILKYNNIAFGSVVLYITKVDLIEPIWYDIDLPNNTLRLFVNNDSRVFSRKMNDYPVVVTSGIIPLERYNPYETDSMTDSIDTATIHCSVMCDHVAQHIINDLLLANEPRAEGADVHHQFGKVGTTLHSMLDITMLGDSRDCVSETSKLVAILDTRSESRHNLQDYFSNLSNPY